MTTGTTTQAAALAAKPPGYIVRIEATVSCTYALELSKAAGKAVCADWIDPNEKWDDQAESTLECALESMLSNTFSEQLSSSLPEVLTAEIEGEKLKITLATDAVCIDLEAREAA